LPGCHLEPAKSPSRNERSLTGKGAENRMHAGPRPETRPSGRAWRPIGPRLTCVHQLWPVGTTAGLGWGEPEPVYLLGCLDGCSQASASGHTPSHCDLDPVYGMTANTSRFDLTESLSRQPGPGRLGLPQEGARPGQPINAGGLFRYSVIAPLPAPDLSVVERVRLWQELLDRGLGREARR